MEADRQVIEWCRWWWQQLVLSSKCRGEFVPPEKPEGEQHLGEQGTAL